VTKRIVDLDDELPAAAQRELNTTGVYDRVPPALQHFVGCCFGLNLVRRGGWRWLCLSGGRF
jgi:Arc/MetJ family transcription regulator